jgi:hypothetical protein
MAARTLRPRHQDDVRKKIQASQLINYLQKHVAGKHDMTTTQVTAALGLLRKAIPDLTSTELTGDPDRPVNMSLQVVGVAPKQK